MLYKAAGVSGVEGSIVLTVEREGKQSELLGSHLLVAAGRAPNTDKLNLNTAGVELNDRGFIRANDRVETTVEGVYAIGDAKGGPAFTHISYDDYRILMRNLFGDEKASIRDRLVPYTVFIEPQLGRIGLSEREARDKGLSIRVAKMPMTWVARALETDQTRGVMKAVVDAENDRILGFAMLGMEGGEIAGAVQIAMMGDLPYTVHEWL